MGCLAVLAGCSSAASGSERIQGHSEYLEKAVAYLQTQAGSDDAVTRAHAIEALQPLKDPRVTTVVEQGLRDKAWVVRFAAAMAAGKRQDTALKPTLQMLVGQEPDGSARVAMIFALQRMGDSTNMSQLARFITSPDTDTRANTAMVLGLLGDKSARGLLETQAKDKEIRVKFEVTAALARLGDLNAQDAILAMSVNKYVEERFIAIATCPDLHRPEAANVLLAGLKDVDPRGNMIAARALCRLGDMTGDINNPRTRDDNYRAGKLALQYAYHRPEADVRALAVLALGEILLPDEEKSVAAFLYKDGEDPHVQLAAAAAVVNVWARAAK